MFSHLFSCSSATLSLSFCTYMDTQVYNNAKCTYRSNRQLSHPLAIHCWREDNWIASVLLRVTTTNNTGQNWSLFNQLVYNGDTKTDRNGARLRARLARHFPGWFRGGWQTKLHGANLNADSAFMSLLHGATDIYLEVVHENKAKSLSWKANARVQI